MWTSRIWISIAVLVLVMALAMAFFTVHSYRWDNRNVKESDSLLSARTTSAALSNAFTGTSEIGGLQDTRGLLKPQDQELESINDHSEFEEAMKCRCVKNPPCTGTGQVGKSCQPCCEGTTGSTGVCTAALLVQAVADGQREEGACPPPTATPTPTPNVTLPDEELRELIRSKWKAKKSYLNKGLSAFRALVTSASPASAVGVPLTQGDLLKLFVGQTDGAAYARAILTAINRFTDKQATAASVEGWQFVAWFSGNLAEGMQAKTEATELKAAQDATVAARKPQVQRDHRSVVGRTFVTGDNQPGRTGSVW